MPEEKKSEETASGLRAQLERRGEIGKSMSGIFEDLEKRSGVPINLFRFLIRNTKPQLIDVGIPVRSLYYVFSVCGYPMIVFVSKDMSAHVWYRGNTILQFHTSTPHNIFVGLDGVVDFRKFGRNEDANYYHILPTTETEPFKNIKNCSNEGDTFVECFYAKHGRAGGWGKDGPICLCDTYDILESVEEGIMAQYLSGPIGDYQFGIIMTNKKLYQVILGLAKDYKNPEY